MTSKMEDASTQIQGYRSHLLHLVGSPTRQEVTAEKVVMILVVELGTAEMLVRRRNGSSLG